MKKMTNFCSILRYVLIMQCLICWANVNAQYVNYGQEPTRVKWQIIETEHYNVIFPKGAEYQGQRVAGMLNNVYSLTGKTLDYNHKKWDVVLHPYSATGLAFVFPAPRRSEWKTMQHQSNECLEWINNLTVHETRHMVQQSLIEEEMPRVFKYIFGQHAAPVIIGAYLPFWYMEGDATCNESALTKTGSGRSPDFLMANRAILVNREPYSMEKAYIGSYKNHIPDIYETGYLMVGGSRYLFAKTIWDDVVLNVAKKPLSFTPFNKGLKNSIGLSKYQLYDTTFKYFQDQYRKQDAVLNPTAYKSISKPNKYFANYINGTQLSNGLYFASKRAQNQVSQFVTIDNNGKEKSKKRLGYGFLESISVMDSMVVWAENRPHIRWEQSNQSYIRILNLNTGKQKRINHKKRYVAPVLSPDKSKLAVVDVAHDYKFYLRIINVQTNEIEWSFSTPDNAYFINPTWSKTGESLYCVLLKTDKQALVEIHSQTNKIDTLIPFAHQHIKNPVEYNNHVYFVGGYTGINNIYSIDKSSLQIYKETESRFGVANPSVNQNKVVYSNYTIDGYKLVEALISDLLHEQVNIEQIQISYPVADAITKQEGELMDFENIKTDFPVSKYSKAKHLLNVHSWGPFALDLNEQMVYPGVSIASQNLLSTTELMAGYKYFTQDNTGNVFANIKYKGLFPIFEANIEYGKKKADYLYIENGDTTLNGFSWMEADFDIRTYVPLNLSRGMFFNRIQPSIGYGLVNKSKVSVPDLNFNTGNTHTGKAGLYMYSILRQSRMDVLADFGVTVNLNYSSLLEGGIHGEYIYSAENWLYLPGLAKTHGVKIYNGYQFKDQSDYHFGDYIRMARGYESIINTELYTFGADYIFPIVHPDLSLFKTLYVNRIKGAFYYDRSYFTSYHYSNNNRYFYNDVRQSAGFELTAQIYLFQLLAPLNIGVRANYLINEGFNFDFLFGVSVDF